MAKYYNDLAVFVAVAREGSFTKAAAKLNVSQSALSQTIKNLEERLGLRLLARTSRNISTTEAGEKLLTSLSSHFEEIDAELDALTHLRDRPAGRIAITSSQHAADTILWPVLEKFLGEYPDVKIEVIVDATMVDLVAERFDAGVRLGEQIEKDMIAMRIGPDLRMAVVGSPSYFDKHGRPEIPEDLIRHNCTNICGSLRMNAALAGVGLSYMLEDYAKPYIDDGRLVRVLEDWCEPFAGYHLYYPSRRQHSPAFVLLLNALRYRE
ncbi:LysR family transcriptional regulator [Rhizobium leguminosarum]|uniref:LysR family transcriptional regulator n=1 Tax=Rhizobium leguminosarum TaxID=384 RepID=UPI001C962DA3|nr:LysR family transcriptional regulator [Rhizobium leguminosarum]MBY5641202.1 LysR family transcriptional regulator [Rhizobium leguminosarum]